MSMSALLLFSALSAHFISAQPTDPPVLNLYSTFSAQFRVYTLTNETLLKPYSDLQGTVLVDADRNKGMIHATMDMNPITEAAQVDILIDFLEGFSLTHVPMLNTCQTDEMKGTY